MISGNKIIKTTEITHRQLCELVSDGILIPVVKRNSPRSHLFNEKDVEFFLKHKDMLQNNLLAFEIEMEWG